MKSKILKVVFGIILTTSLMAGCSSIPKISYGDAKSVETVTASFGSTDLNQIAEAMARSLLQAKVISTSIDTPVITLADVKNKTTEYIDTRVITEKIRTQLTKSGKVQFAVSITEMQNQTDELERQNQSGLYKEKGAAKIGNMLGAKYRIEGAISSIVKQNKEVKDIYYIFNLSLVNVESGLIEWADEKEIRKTELR